MPLFLAVCVVVWVISVPSGVFHRTSVFGCLFVENDLKACGLPHCSENAVELAFYEAVERRACKYSCRVICRCVRGDVAWVAGRPSCNDHFFSTRILNLPTILFYESVGRFFAPGQKS